VCIPDVIGALPCGFQSKKKKGQLCGGKTTTTVVVVFFKKKTGCIESNQKVYIAQVHLHARGFWFLVCYAAAQPGS